MKNIKTFFTIACALFVIFVFVKFRSYMNEPELAIVLSDMRIKTPPQNDTDQFLPNKVKDTKSSIAAVVPWQGADPYPSVDWSGAKPELKTAVDEFQKKWGQKLHVRQVYRPIGYMHHLRSAWEVWRIVNGKSYTEGYKCEGYKHIDPKTIGKLTELQKKYLNTEARRHEFIGGDTPPGCVSDHAKGIAVDITPPSEAKEYQRFMETAYSVGLCHYIKGDEPHFGLTAQLPSGTDCFQK